MIEKLTDDKFYGACYDPSKIERPIRCHMPLDSGNCGVKNYSSRFYYNSFHHRCMHFIYSGCNGNENNFEKWEQVNINYYYYIIIIWDIYIFETLFLFFFLFSPNKSVTWNAIVRWWFPIFYIYGIYFFLSNFLY